MTPKRATSVELTEQAVAKQLTISANEIDDHIGEWLRGRLKDAGFKLTTNALSAEWQRTTQFMIPVRTFIAGSGTMTCHEGGSITFKQD